jgi:type I restriction enzyme S subunit
MEKLKTIPSLRFPEFEENWEIKKLGETALNISSGKSKTRNDDGKYPLYGSTGLIGYSDSFEYEGKNILIARVGANAGSMYKVDGNYSVTDNTLILNLFKTVDADYIFYTLIKNNLNKLVFGSGQPLITGGQLKELRISFPTLPEQTKIASFLTAVDEKLQSLKQKKTLLEQYKKGVMQKIFSQELRFKDDNGNEYADWEEKKLGELTIKVDKKNKSNIKYPIYSINNKEGFLPQSDQFDGMDSNERGYDISLYKIIEKNTFAYNPARINVGSIGYSGELSKIIISSLYVCFKTTDSLEDSYLLHYLNTKKFSKAVFEFQEGGVRSYLFYESFSKIKIPFPSNKEQTKIANFLSTIDDKINHCQVQIEKTELWKKGLLQQMFC